MVGTQTSEFIRPVRRYITLLFIGWTIVVAASFAYSYFRDKDDFMEVARIEARVAFTKDIILRHWIAESGGIYVPVSEKIRPNPHLADRPERDIVTPSGRKLTLMNPAYVTRVLYESGKREHGIFGHITSLDPIREDNAPDEWERQSLIAFGKGKSEEVTVETIDGKQYLRLMKPLVTEKECLDCHSAQGYKEGDIRGGISIRVPLDQLMELSRRNFYQLLIVHGVLLFVGAGLIYMGGLRAIRSERERSILMEKIANLVLHDDLTGLFNRRGFLTLAEKQFSLAQRLKKGMLLYFVDLDKMKWVNDTMGHYEGDKALKAVARILKETFRESDVIARIGGDEFIVLLLEEDGVDSEILNSRLQDNLDAYNELEMKKYKLEISTGLAYYDPEIETSIEELIDEADRSMYEQKKKKQR